MQKSIKIILGFAAVIAVAVFLLGQELFFTTPASVQVAVTDVDATVAITTNTTSMINKALFGIQTRGFFDDFMYDRYNPAVYNQQSHTFSAPEARLMQNVYAVGASSYRYPGGTFVRYYHPSTPSSPKKGYGINPADIENDDTLYGQDWFTNGSCDTVICNYVSQYQNYLPFPFSTAVVNVAQNTGPGRTVIVVANLQYGNPAETVQGITDLQNAGASIVGVEMGNEHFSTTPGINMTPTQYIAKAKLFATAIRNTFPNMKIGLVATNIYPITNPDYDNYLIWNQAMANAINTEMHNGKRLFDAIVPHIYKPIKCDPLNYPGNLNGLKDCARYKTHQLARAATMQQANQGSSWGSLNTMTLAEGFTYLRNVYGNTTPIWITEWGLSKDQGGATDESVYANTVLYGTYMQDFYNFINKYNVTYPNVITTAYFHILTGGIADAAITKKQNDETFIDFNDSIYNRRVPWFVLRTMNPIYNTPAVTLGNTTTTLTQTTPYIDFTTYRDVTNNYIYLYFTNKSGQTAKVPSITVDGAPLTSAEASTNTHAEIVSGASLFAGNGYTFFDHDGQQDPITYINPDNIDVTNTVIPGFSFGYFKFPKPALEVPTNLTLAQNNQTVSVTWTGTGAPFYEIWRDGSLLNPPGAVSATNYLDTAVSYGQTYVYKVRAKFSSTSFSAFTADASITLTISNGPPTVPTGLSASSVSSNSLSLSWTASTDDDSFGISYYEVFQDGVSIGTVTGTNMPVTALTASTTYSYQVWACDLALLCSPKSSAVSATTLPPPQPDLIILSITSVPANPNPGDLVTFKAKIKNQGTASATATNGNHFIDFFLDGSPVPFVWKDNYAGTILPGAQITLSANSPQWTATVGQHDIGAMVDASLSIPETIETNNTFTKQIGTVDSQAPSTPANLVTVSGCTDIALTWGPSTDNVGVTGYNIYRDGSLIPFSSTNVTSFNDTTVLQPSSHSYNITAYDAADLESAMSPSVTATTTDCTNPTVALATTAPGPTYSGNISLDATVDEVANNVDFYLDSVTFLGNSTTSPYTINLNTTNFANGMHAIIAKATDSAGNIGTSNTLMLDIQNIVIDYDPTPPTDLVVTNITKTGFDLSWTASTDDHGVTGYKIYKDGGYVTTVTGLTYTATGLTAGTTYSYFVRAVDTVGNTADSGDAVVTTESNQVVGGGGNGGGSSGSCLAGYPCSYILSYNGGHHYTIVSDTNSNTANQGNNNPPSNNDIIVKIINPKDNATIKMNQKVTINAQVVSSQSVSQVKFYTFGKLRCTVTTAPFICSYTPPKWLWNYTMPIVVTTFTTDGNYASVTNKVKVVK